MEENNTLNSSDKDKNENNSKSQITNQTKSNMNKQNMTNNTTENLNLNDNNNNSSLNIYNYINDMPLENLNDFYDIESSLFLKRIEKLNLKFYWISECILNQQDIKYPYNKLFLILFKQISLYIEEIIKLNKQLKQKNKNEKNFQIKLAKMKQKEKENTLNMQMLKNLQRDNKLLQKKNEKNKNDIEKLNKKLLTTYNNINYNSPNSINTYEMNLNRNNNFFIGSPKNSFVSIGYDNINTHKSPLAKKNNKIFNLNNLISDNNTKYINVNIKNKEKKMSSSIDNNLSDKKNKNKNKNDDFVNKGIIQCNEEIQNLELIEGILKEFKNKCNNKNIKGNISNKIEYDEKNNINCRNNYGKIKKEKNNTKFGISFKTNV